MFGLVLALAATAGNACSQVPAPVRGEYVASAGGEVYYWVGCDAWRSLPPESLRWYPTPAAAEAAGLRGSDAAGCSGPESAGSATALASVCTIERIVDGDTVVCREHRERVRLLLIDAPEMGQGEPGAASRDALAAILPVGERTRMEMDVQERDRYGRLLAYLYTAGGEMANEAMVREGYAVVLVYPPNVRHVERLRAASEAARRTGRGLWGRSAFECAPADFRRGRCR